jgi:hypothetical protein
MKAWTQTLDAKARLLKRGRNGMTDEERKKLCENLRDRNNVAYQDCEDAADEIERLLQRLKS